MKFLEAAFLSSQFHYDSNLITILQFFFMVGTIHYVTTDCHTFIPRDLMRVFVRPEKFQFLEKGQNRNFGYKIVISVKNPKFIL